MSDMEMRDRLATLLEGELASVRPFTSDAVAGWLTKDAAMDLADLIVAELEKGQANE